VSAGTTAQAGFLRSTEEREDKGKRALSGAFSFEFLNRVDEVVTFERLSPESVVRIAQVMLENVKRRAEDKGVEIEFPEEVCKLIAKKGYDPVYGARPLRRTVATLVEDPLAKKLLSGEIEKGMSIEAFALCEKVEYRIK
jgi:ATP-dependent Clp protease ATP-binding subunit ClpC